MKKKNILKKGLFLTYDVKLSWQIWQGRVAHSSEIRGKCLMKFPIPKILNRVNLEVFPQEYFIKQKSLIYKEWFDFPKRKSLLGKCHLCETCNQINLHWHVAQLWQYKLERPGLQDLRKRLFLLKTPRVDL